MAERLTIDVAMVSWPNHPDRVKYLAQVLASLKSHLSASEHDLRFYCSVEAERDPKCTWHGDDTIELLESYGVTWQWHDAPANLGANHNAAMRMGSGEFVYLQQDDWWLGTKRKGAESDDDYRIRLAQQGLTCVPGEDHPEVKRKEPESEDAYRIRLEQYRLDLSPGAALLARHKKLDIVRYSWPVAPGMHPTCDGDVEGWRKVDVKGPWPYGDDPHLRRRDFMDKWGWYYDGGKHGTASGGLMGTLVKRRGQIVLADKVYYQHIGYASAVLGDVRSGKNRRYE
jgi:hypothetical protein